MECLLKFLIIEFQLFIKYSLTLPLSSEVAQNSNFDCEIPFTTTAYMAGNRNRKIPFSNTVWKDDSFGNSNANVIRLKKDEPCFNSTIPSNFFVEEGKTVTLLCIVQHVDLSTIVMSWWKEKADNEISVGTNVIHERFSIDRSSPDSWNLKIENTSISDTGVYICQINSKLLRERFIQLNVLERKPISHPSRTSDMLVKDEAMKPVLPSYPQASHWKPFITSSLYLPRKKSPKPSTTGFSPQLHFDIVIWLVLICLV